MSEQKPWYGNAGRVRTGSPVGGDVVRQPEPKVVPVAPQPTPQTKP